MAHGRTAFTDSGFPAGASFPVNRFEEIQSYRESRINSEGPFDGIIGSSSALRSVLEQIAIVAPTDSTVLLHGETAPARS